MSGHNKWSKIKHKKAASDAQKSKIFSKVVKLLTSEAKKSGGNLESPGLKSAVEKAKQVNMPKENIENAIKKAERSEEMERITYEAYGPGGSALIIEALTSNRNKTAAEVKYILSKWGLFLAEPGSAVWAFEKQSGQWLPKNTIALSENDLTELEKIVNELEDNDEIQEVFTNAE
jgi:YebC/PmpR family DNA-binding regulatory protein